RDVIEGVHLSGSRAAAAAVRAGDVGRLVLTHIPAWNDPEVCRAQAQTVWPGGVEVATAGHRFDLPTAPSEVVVDDGAAARMFSSYRAAHPGRVFAEETAAVEFFADSAAKADELLDLVLRGQKRTTAGLVANYRADGEELPPVGSHRVACDGSGAPRAVLRVLEARIGAVATVDEQFARDDGDGDRTRASWLAAHQEHFAVSCERLGLAYTEDLEAVFERFAVVWPLEHADR
ncbi:MAG: ASCH domain-containing protein, partial [Ornithinibacter sp.]